MLLILFLFSQYQFGQNKVQYRKHDWLMHETEHFEIYHYKTGKVLIPFAEDVLEEAYSRLKERFEYREKQEEPKIPVIIYKSHPDFEETNVIMERIPESVGGFTEIFKNRIVLPFNGSYADFRHILYHELVHVFQYRILYGKGVTALQRLATLRVPLWFIEGMAELESVGWDESGETYIRDAVLNNRLFSIRELNMIGGYPIYKEGQSILHFIRERYGDKKIGELLNKIKVTKTLTGAIQQVLGISEEKLNEEWIRTLKKKYWPLIEDKEYPDKIARPLVTHKEFKNIYNYAPSISPGGEEVIYYTDREGEVQIRIVSALTGEDMGLLVKGGRSPMFESLHLMEGHLDYSPDGANVIFPAKERGRDVLYIYDVRNRKVVRRLDLKLDRIQWPEYSRDGDKIVFMGLRNGSSDIYVYNLNRDSLRNLTHDRYSDLQPGWMGDSVIFVSDRPELSEWNYNITKLFVSDLDGNISHYLTFGDNIISPVAYKSEVYFISYRDGGKNLYSYNPDSGEVKQLTDFIGSLEYFSISNRGKAAISVYNNIGWDIYLIESVKELKRMKPNPPREFSSEYIEVSIDEKSEERKAPIRLSIDYVSTTLGYYSDYGLYGYLYLGMSDMLGNHRLYALFNNTDLTNSDFYTQYLYLRHRIDYSLYLMKQSDYFLYGDNYLRGDIWNIAAQVWYPINRFNRIELGLSGYRLGQRILEWDYDERDWISVASSTSYGNFGTMSYIVDNTIWGYYAPIKGARGRVTLQKNIFHGENLWDVETFRMDFRKYWYLNDDWNIAMQFFLHHGWGEDKNLFSTLAIGGGRGIRGYDYNENSLVGTTAGFFKLEFRIPLIKRLQLGFPPISLGRIDGALFMDVGGATYNYREFSFFETENTWPALEDARMSFGLEARFDLGITMLNFDISKKTDLDMISEGTFYDFYLGFPF